MAWRIVRQPNGLLARFSDVCDHFTHINMTDSEALRLCVKELGNTNEAHDKVHNGRMDIEPWGTRPGSGLDRWNDSLETIRLVRAHNNPSLMTAAQITKKCSIPANEAIMEIV